MVSRKHSYPLESMVALWLLMLDQYGNMIRFVYHLRFDTDNYITLPWDKVTDVDPSTYLVNDPNPIDTIEIQLQQNLSRTYRSIK